MKLGMFAIGEELAKGRYRINSHGSKCGLVIRYSAIDLARGDDVLIHTPHPRFSQSSRFCSTYRNHCQRLMGKPLPGVQTIADVLETSGTFAHVTRPLGIPLADTLAVERLNIGSIGEQRMAALRKWLPPAAATFDCLHAVGIVHRNVTPQSIWVQAGNFAQVSDYLVATSLQEMDGLDPPHRFRSSGGFPIGEIDYLAPELLLELPADNRVDQYALAVVVFQALAGQLPFRPGSAHIVAARHLSVPSPALEKFVSWMPACIAKAVSRALSKTPAERFDTCHDFATAVLEGIREVDSKSINRMARNK